MSELPPADTTPLRVTGTLFKDLIFAFEPQDIPDGARILRTLKRNGAVIMDEMEDASVVLIDPELPSALDLLRKAAGKIVLHYSWVNKSLNFGYPLVESSNWGDCRVTPDNINNNFGYVPPPPPSNPQLQTPRPTPESRSSNFFTTSRYSQGTAGIVPSSSQPPYTPTPSHWSPDSVTLQQQVQQFPPTNQVAAYNSQPIQPPNMFSHFPMSQPTDVGTMTYNQQPAWPPFHSGPYSTIQTPTIEDLQRAYELMVMWFQRPMYQQLPAPPTPTQPSTAFHLSPPPPTQNSSSTSTQFEAPRVPGTPVATMPHQDLADSGSPLLDLGDFSGGPSSQTSALAVPSFIQSETIPSPPPFDNPAGPATLPTPLHTLPKLFEHDVGKPIMFCVPIILKNRGKIAEIFRATGGGFTDDVEDADYVVLGQWEEHYFDEMWYSAQDCNKLTVTPAFVIDSYQRGQLVDPYNYPTRGPEKPRKGERKAVRSRPATGVRGRRGRSRGGVSLAPTPSGDAPKWLRFFREAEGVKSFQYIGAMFKKNPELTHDALAIHLHNKMSNHTINSWKKYCLYHKDTIEDLRKRATSNAEKKAISQAVAEATRAEETEETLPIPQQVDLPQTNSQQVDLQQTDPQQPAPQQTVPQLIAPPQSTSQPTVPQLNIPQKTLPEPTVLPPTIPQQATPQQSVPRQATTLHETLPPQPSYEKAAEPGVVLVKTEPLDEDQLDFVFVTEVLSGWKPHEETDAALWKRMETMRTSTTAPSWEAFCEKHWSRFEHFFEVKSA